MNRKAARRQGIIFEEPDDELNRLAARVLDAAVEVHRRLGPGFLESFYERALDKELTLREIAHEVQVPVRVSYKGDLIGEGRMDLLVDERLVVELKAVEAIAPVHLVQVRSYLKATALRLGLVINFNVPFLLQGVRRIVLTPNAFRLAPLPPRD